MLDFVKIKTDLETSFNRDKSKGIDIDININVINEDNGKFSVSVFEEKCFVKMICVYEFQIRNINTGIFKNHKFFKIISYYTH